MYKKIRICSLKQNDRHDNKFLDEVNLIPMQKYQDSIRELASKRVLLSTIIHRCSDQFSFIEAGQYYLSQHLYYNEIEKVIEIDNTKRPEHRKMKGC